MIEVSRVSYAWGDGKPALADVDFSLPSGRLLCLVGANGSGKSTLLALLAGLLTPTSGRIQVAGAVSPGAEKDVRRAAGLMLQDADLQIIGGTVGEDICLGLAPGDTAGEDLARRLAARFRLEDLWDEPVQTLSYGQKRKLCLAAVLRLGPGVLLYDEPFAGLDYPAVREMRAVFSENRAAGLTQIVATHDVEPLADMADDWAVLSRGELVGFGGAQDVFPLLSGHDVRPPCAWLLGRPSLSWDLDGAKGGHGG